MCMLYMCVLCVCMLHACHVCVLYMHVCYMYVMSVCCTCMCTMYYEYIVYACVYVYVVHVCVIHVCCACMCVQVHSYVRKCVVQRSMLGVVLYSCALYIFRPHFSLNQEPITSGRLAAWQTPGSACLCPWSLHRLQGL